MVYLIIGRAGHGLGCSEAGLAKRLGWHGGSGHRPVWPYAPLTVGWSGHGLVFQGTRLAISWLGLGSVGHALWAGLPMGRSVHGLGCHSLVWPPAGLSMGWADHRQVIAWAGYEMCCQWHFWTLAGFAVAWAAHCLAGKVLGWPGHVLGYP
jgi:hypothetical protein